MMKRLLSKQAVLRSLVSSPIVQCVPHLPHLIQAASVPVNSSARRVNDFCLGGLCGVGSADWVYKEPWVRSKRKIVSPCSVPVGGDDLPILSHIILSQVLMPIVKEVDPFKTICAVGESSKQLRSLMNSPAVASEINLSSAKPSDVDSDPYYYLFLERCSEAGNGQARLLFGVSICFCCSEFYREYGLSQLRSVMDTNPVALYAFSVLRMGHADTRQSAISLLSGIYEVKGGFEFERGALLTFLDGKAHSFRCLPYFRHDCETDPLCGVIDSDHYCSTLCAVCFEYAQYGFLC